MFCVIFDPRRNDKYYETLCKPSRWTETNWEEKIIVAEPPPPPRLLIAPFCLLYNIRFGLAHFKFEGRRFGKMVFFFLIIFEFQFRDSVDAQKRKGDILYAPGGTFLVIAKLTPNSSYKHQKVALKLFNDFRDPSAVWISSIHRKLEQRKEKLIVVGLVRLLHTYSRYVYLILFTSLQRIVGTKIFIVNMSNWTCQTVDRKFWVRKAISKVAIWDFFF